jgi:uncharacterized protein (TIGR00106 family)
MAVVEVSITPLGTASPSVSRFVAACVDVVEESGLSYQLTPMGTIIEGEIGVILDVIRTMHEIPFSNGAQRVSTLIKIDDRRDREQHDMTGKVSAVTSKLRRRR